MIMHAYTETIAPP